MVTKRILLVSAFALTAPAFALADDDVDPTGWYVSGELGASWFDQEGDFTGGATSFETDYDAGWALVFAAGHQWDNIRLEFELGWRENEANSFETSVVAPVRISDGTTQFTQMLNVLYDFDVTDNVELSLGGGLGGALIESEYALTTGTQIVDDEDYVFAYQLMANATYELRDDTDVFVGYRYTRSDTAEMDFALAPTVTGEDIKGDNHTLTFGVRHFFDVGARPRKPQQAVAPETGPAPKPPETFVVFFDFNRWSLSAEGQAVVVEAAEAFAKTGSVRVKVVGHTDAVGSEGYNLALSQRRAASVAEEMVRLGVPGEAISTEGRGFGEPMVPTGPGVREPQNRRAVIELN